jgi:hypothetical protein
MILLGIVLICLLTYLAARRHAAGFNRRDQSRDYRTTYQRLAKW